MRGLCNRLGAGRIFGAVAFEKCFAVSRVARRHDDHCAIAPDELPPGGGVVFRKKRFCGDIDETGIADIAIAIGEGELHRLGDDVQIFDTVMAERLEVVAFENVECYEHDDALRVGRALVDIETRISCVDGLRLFGYIFGEVVRAEQAALLGIKIGALARERAAVKHVRALFRDGYERMG